MQARIFSPMTPCAAPDWHPTPRHGPAQRNGHPPAGNETLVAVLSDRKPGTQDMRV